VRCFGHIHLSEGLAAFRTDRQPRSLERRTALRPEAAVARGNVIRGPQPPPSRAALERALVELQRAEARLPHVSRGYFVTRWRSHQLPPAGQERELLVQQLIEGGFAEEFELTDPEGRLIRAIRPRNPDVA
jgi:hypothetical protein